MPPNRPSPSRERGQASLEYAGVLAVVAAVLVLAGAVVGGAPLFNAVLGGFQRALCLVTGGECTPRELEACTVRARETGGELGVKLTFVKVGRSLAVLREEKSDGTVDITLVDGRDAAPTAAIGASGGVRTGKGGAGFGAMAEVELLVRLGRTRVWHRSDRASADRLVRDIIEHAASDAAVGSAPPLRPVRGVAHALGFDGDRLPRPDIDGLDAGIEGVVSAGVGEAGTISAGFAASLGGSVDRASGNRTFVFGIDGSVGAELTRATGAGSASGAGGASLAVTYDKHGAPAALEVSWARAGSGSAGLDLPQSPSGGKGGRVEVTTTLDLTQPANRAAWEHVLAGLTPKGAVRIPGALGELAERLRSAGSAELTRYGTSDTAYGAEAEAALGARAGVAAEVTRSSSALQDAWTRPPGGAWEQRTDCLEGVNRA